MLKRQLGRIPQSRTNIRGGVCVYGGVRGGGGGGRAKLNPRALFLSLRGWVEESSGNKVMEVLTGILLLSVALTWNNISIVVVYSVSRLLVSAGADLGGGCRGCTPPP